MWRMGPIVERLWKDESGISSVEYALLLAMIASGIVMAADMLSNATANQLSETAILLDSDSGSCGNDGSGDGIGGDGGSGQGGENTC